MSRYGKAHYSIKEQVWNFKIFMGIVVVIFLKSLKGVNKLLQGIDHLNLIPMFGIDQSHRRILTKKLILNPYSAISYAYQFSNMILSWFH